jgi:hypothetical protein
MLAVANLLIAPFAASADGEDAEYAAEIGAPPPPPQNKIFLFSFCRAFVVMRHLQAERAKGGRVI